jgi:hypothetical protein
MFPLPSATSRALYSHEENNRPNCEFVAQHGSVGLLPDEQD